MLTELLVYDYSDTFSPDGMLVATIHFDLRRRAISTTLEYSREYAAHPLAYQLDPRLPISPFVQHVDGMPGMLRDSCPDRWGRHLINKYRGFRYRQDNMGIRTYDDVDYLIETFDLTREGSLRFKTRDSAFLSPHEAVPQQIQLPALMDASNHIATERDALQDIKKLLGAGSASLGGARPKACVRDGDRLLLAKFPHPGDDWDVMAWEKTALDLAGKAGIRVPERRIVKVGTANVLLLERFDRVGSRIDGPRIPYMSAMTALAADDGDTRDYAELAETAIDVASRPEVETEELFRRICLNIALNNTDDHLRNWAFLRTGGHWRLSPAFDMNPDPAPSASSATSIMGSCGPERSRNLPELASYLGITPVRSTEISIRTIQAMRNWKAVARRNGVRDHEIARFEPALETGLKRLSNCVKG